MNERIPEDEVFRAAAARVILAETQLAGAISLLGVLRRVLPAPRPRHKTAAKADMARALRDGREENEVTA